MVYEFGEAVLAIAPEDIAHDRLTAGMMTIEDFERNYEALGLSSNIWQDYERDKNLFRSEIFIYDHYCCGVLSLVNLEDILGARDRLGFIIKKNLFLLVVLEDADGSCASLFETAVRRFRLNALTLEKIIYGVFDQLLANDAKWMESMEFQISELEDDLEDDEIQKSFNQNMLHMKKQLLILRNYYEQLIDIGESLQENENGVFDKGAMRYFKIFTDKVERLSNNIQMLRESLMQLREVYQAMLDYNLNQVMKIFTIVTVIFLPLTLIVGWYGMNFKFMPELEWPYGYAAVFVLSIAIVIGCVIWFKKKKFL